MRLKSTALGTRDRTFVVQSEQPDYILRFGCGPHRDSDPAGIGQDMMRFGPSGSDHLVADSARERQVSEFSVQVPQFAAAEPELDSAKPVLV